MSDNKKYLKKITISNYSSRNAAFYDDPMNKNFVYGELTIDFVNKIELKKTDNKQTKSEIKWQRKYK